MWKWSDINSDSICRKCLRINKEGFGSGFMKFFNDLDIKTIEEYIEKSEFEVVELIEVWNKEDNKCCPYCGSDNIEFFNVQLNEYELFNYSKFTNLIDNNNNFYLIYQVDKKNNNLGFHTEMSKSYDSKFISSAIKKIVKIVNSSPVHKFIPNSNGHFYIFISAYKNNKNKYIFKIERFINYGISREEIIEELTTVFQ